MGAAAVGAAVAMGTLPVAADGKKAPGVPGGAMGTGGVGRVPGAGGLGGASGAPCSEMPRWIGILLISFFGRARRRRLGRLRRGALQTIMPY